MNRSMTACTLYDMELSGNCFKVRLFCALLGLELDLEPVDLMAGAHKKSPFIDVNPFGQVPVLQDDDVVLRDSQAILVYLARKYGGETWLPTDPVGMASVVNWLMVAENEIARGPADARLRDKFGFPVDADQARENAANILGLLEARLSENEWLALDRPTIADIACMPYVALGHEGGVPLDSYPAIRAWVGRIKALPGFVSMAAL
ncbi:MAG: glutathione S-transferase [Methyloceanibacter sp.]